MAISVVQSKKGNANGTTLQVTFDTNPTAGSLLLVGITIYSDDGPNFSISDNNSNSWNENYDSNYAGADTAGMGYALNANSGSTTVTITAAGSNSFITATIVEVSGILTTSALDQNNSNSTTSGTWDSGNITSTQADEFFFGAMAQDSGNYTLTPDGAFTQLKEEEDWNNWPCGNWSGKIVTATETESFSGTISSSAPFWAGIATFKATASGTDTSDSQPAYSKGQDTAVDAQPTYSKGQATSSTQVPAYAKGQADVSSSVPVFSSGLTYFPFTEDFTGQSDGISWRLSHWATVPQFTQFEVGESKVGDSRIS